MAIAWVDSALHAWARWAVAQESRDVGYPPVSPMFRETPSSGVYRSYEPGFTGIDIMDIDRAVTSLPRVLRLVVIEYYKRRHNADDCAARLGIGRRLLFRFLDDAHGRVAERIGAIESCCAA